MTFRDYFYNVGSALSCLFNALIGGEADESLSLRIGRSILRGGLASRVWMPAGLKGHFVRVAKRSAGL